MEEAALQSARQVLARVKSRAAFPVLGIAMALSTAVVGMERASFLTHAMGGSVPVADSSVDDSALAAASALALRTAASQAGPGVPAPAVAGLDLDVNHQQVDAWVKRLTTSLKGDFQLSLTRMDKYDDMISAKLDERKMPRELIYLAMIESNFNPTAKSRVKAVGMWQFMSATARQFGLTVGRHVDERKDPAKATDAALTYLAQLHDRFGSWYLAAAAYNSGQGTVSKAMKKVLGRTKGTDEDFFRIAKALPKETRDYVPKLIASAKVGSNPTRYGLEP
jgi:soluble lytic murein transglycosylase-like protein